MVVCRNHDTAHLLTLQWQKLTAEEVTDQICKLAKKGLTPSQIGKAWDSRNRKRFPCGPFLPAGVILRDSHGVAQVRWMTGNKILRILKKKGLAPGLPEDLYFLIKKAVAIRKHMEKHRKVSSIGTAIFKQRTSPPLPVCSRTGTPSSD